MKKTAILTCIIIMALSLQSQEVRTINHIIDGDVKKTITISGIDSITFSNFNVPNTPEGVLINGVVWATCNVDMPGTFASQPNKAGMFYQWNRNIGWSSTDPLVNSNGGTTWDDSTPTGNSWEPENDPCPNGWRLPTHAEQESLINSGSFWGELDGVSGRYYGYYGSSSDQRVFFPAAGFRDLYDGNLFNVGIYGYYWSGTTTNAGAHYFQFSSIGNTMYSHDRRMGFSVRCVLE